MSAGAAKLGHQVAKAPFFDTVRVNVKDAGQLVKQAESQGINLRQLDNSCVTVALDETTRCTAARQDLQDSFLSLRGKAYLTTAHVDGS